MNERSKLVSRLAQSSTSRASYIRSKIDVLIPAQLRALRLKRPLKQAELAHEARMKQSRISAMERPGEVNFNIETLIRMAAALRVGLQVRFVKFSEMVAWEDGFSQDEFDVQIIDNDVEFVTGSSQASELAHWKPSKAVAEIGTSQAQAISRGPLQNHWAEQGSPALLSAGIGFHEGSQ